MSHLVAINRALDFVEAHLTQEITVADMAAAASYSLYHFSRTFNRVVHHTPYDYLMRRRLSESARQLLGSDKRILDIALDYQFNNPETYSRAFKRMFGVQPSQCRGQEGLDERLLLPPLTLDYLRHINQGQRLKPSLKEIDTLYLVGLMTLVGDDPEIIPQLWEKLGHELGRVQGVRGTEAAYGITWYPEARAGGERLYLAAVEAASLEAMGSALVVKTIAPLSCASFLHKGSRRELRHTLNYIYGTWLPKSGERLACPMVIEYFGKDWDRCRESEIETEWQLYIPIA
jgi:AraC family transcriptional regulator